ncbi:MAG: S1C family serine protease [Fidelibacterota bacterium]
MNSVRLFLPWLLVTASLSAGWTPPGPAVSSTAKGGQDRLSVTCNVDGSRATVIVTRDGETKEYAFDLDDLQVLDSLQYDIEGRFPDLKDFPFHLSAHPPRSVWLGVHLQPLTDQLRDYFGVQGSRGVLVSEVVEKSPADEAGLKAGDVILSIDREDVRNTQDVVRIIQNREPGDEVRIRIVRKGKRQTLKATLEGTTPGPRPFRWFRGWEERGSLDSLRKEVQDLRRELDDLRRELEKRKEP